MNKENELKSLNPFNNRLHKYIVGSPSLAIAAGLCYPAASSMGVVVQLNLGSLVGQVFDSDGAEKDLNYTLNFAGSTDNDDYLRFTANDFSGDRIQFEGKNGAIFGVKASYASPTLYSRNSTINGTTFTSYYNVLAPFVVSTPLNAPMNVNQTDVGLTFKSGDNNLGVIYGDWDATARAFTINGGLIETLPNTSFTFATPIPEVSSSALLIALGAAGIAGYRNRNRNKLKNRPKA